ncbi:MAG: cysteine desulfurase [Candidatus Obscuribacterales bacterium]
MFDVNAIRKDFPILDRKIDGKPLIYLDNAATSQKPQQVIDALTNYYSTYNANIHRGIHTLSEEATEAYEGAREKIRAFINARETREIIFVRNATEAINLVMYTWGKKNIQAGDEIVLSAMEHHSNLVPWQMLAKEKGAKLVFVELTADGKLDMESARQAISAKTKLVAITLMSNVLGCIVDVKALAEIAHKHGAVLLVDGAQGVPHLPVDVQALDCDFLAFSFHKMLGPTGIGILYGKAKLLEEMPPFMGGGDMISSVSRERSLYNQLPWKFEAGTPNIADVIGAGAAIDYLTKLGMANVRRHEMEITAYALDKLRKFPNVTIYGPKEVAERGGVIAFNVRGVHPHDLGHILSEQGIAVRAGHHCCQPLMRQYDLMGTARASFYIYNTEAEVDTFVQALTQAEKVLGHVAV